MIKNILLVGAGSFLGGIARYLVSIAMKNMSTTFPWATMTVNIVGCLLIGILWGYETRINTPSQINLFFVMGFCGAFTTFSTFSKESLALLQAGSTVAFCLYTLGSVILGILAVILGFAIAK